MANPNYNFNRNNFAFQNNLHLIPPMLPPPPPPPDCLNPNNSAVSVQDFVKSIESKCKMGKEEQVENPFLSKLKQRLLTTKEAYSIVKDEVEKLRENINEHSAEVWQHKVQEIEEYKIKMLDTMSELSSTYLDLSRKSVAKRSAKRLRLKKQKEARRKEKIEMQMAREEKSRRIDEQLKKIQDKIQKAKQIEEAKQQADIVLKDVHKKRYEAKRNINKLDALVKLRKARQNTAKGRGESVCENDAAKFQEHIEKLKHLWVQKLAMYEVEENELRAQLDQGKGDTSNSGDKEVVHNLEKWHQVLFGGTVAPQADFNGDVHWFVRTRCEWDRYISSAGTAIPAGWVVPAR